MEFAQENLPIIKMCSCALQAPAAACELQALRISPFYLH